MVILPHGGGERKCESAAEKRAEKDGKKGAPVPARLTNPHYFFPKTRTFQE